MFAIFAGFYYWFEKMWGVKYNEFLGHAALLAHVHRREHRSSSRSTSWACRACRGATVDYPVAFAYWNHVSSIGFAITLVGMVVCSCSLVEAAVRRRKAEANPWGEGATTLEWTLPSPPPFHQFTELPRDPRRQPTRPAFGVGSTAAGRRDRTAARSMTETSDRMTETAAPPPPRPRAGRTMSQLLKPRVMSLVVFTALTGLVCARHADEPASWRRSPSSASPSGAGALGGAEHGLRRRHRRPDAPHAPPAGAVGPGAARRRAGAGRRPQPVLGRADGAGDQLLAAGLLAFTIFFYAVVYTLWLKRSTPQNIVIGGLAGALPPVIGWAAASGTAPLNAWLLCAIIFIWTPPHFWALSLYTQRGLRHGRRADDAGGQGRGLDPPRDPGLQPAARRRSRSRRRSPAWAARSIWPSPARRRRGLPRAGRPPAPQPAPATTPAARERPLRRQGGRRTRATSSPSRSSTCSCCSPPCWPSGSLRPRAAGPMSEPARSDPAQAKARRRRSLAIALALGVFVILVFIVTIVRMKGHVADIGF